MRPIVLLTWISIGLAGLILCLRGQARISETRRELHREEVRLAGMSNAISMVKSDIAILRGEIEAQERTRNSTFTSIEAARREMAKIEPESLWAEPPRSLPDWQPDSPYVWLSKEMLTHLPIRPFTDDGELQPGVAMVMTLNGEQQRRVNQMTRAVLEEYQQLENATVKLSTNHLPGISTSDGKKLTIEVRPLPKDGERLKEELIAEFKSALGEQRAALLLESARSWIAQKFSNFSEEPKIISVARHRNGTYNVSLGTPSGQAYMSVGGPTSIDPYIPPHLLHYFDDLRSPSPE